MRERHRLFAEHVGARAQARNRLRGMQRHRRRDVHGIRPKCSQRGVERVPRRQPVGRGLGGVARHQALQPAARLRQNGGKHALGRDVADSDYEPSNHRYLW